MQLPIKSFSAFIARMFNAAKQYLIAKTVRISLTILVLLLAILFGSLLYHRSHRVVTVDIYGSAADANTLAVMETVNIAQAYLPGRMRIRLHPVLKPTDSGVTSYALEQSQNTQPQNIDALLQQETDEALRQRAIQYFGITPLTNYLENRYRTPLTGQDIISSLALPSGIVSLLMQKEKSHLDSDNRQFAELLKHHDIVRYQVPQVFLNGELYSGSGSPHVIASHIVRILLRNGKPELPPPARISLFGDRITLTLSRPYRINAVPEAYTEADCQDQKDKTGVLADIGTPYMRCAYHDPARIQLSVYGATAKQTNELIDGLAKDFKGLSVQTISDKKEFAAVQKAVRDLKLPDTLKGIAQEPYLVLDANVAQDPAGKSYYQSGLLIPLPDGRMLFNSIPFQSP